MKHGENTANPSNAYSYHTFLFPFLWKAKNMDVFETSLLKGNNNWRLASWNADEPWQDLEKKSHLFYNTWQYYHQNVRNAIYGMDSAVVRNYLYELPTTELRVCKFAGGSIDYELQIEAIRLRVFNTGVAILIFEMENHQHRSIEAVLQINAFLRRVYPPFTNENKECPLYVSSIEIAGVMMAEDFSTLEMSQRLYYMSPLIRTVLGSGFSFDPNLVSGHRLIKTEEQKRGLDIPEYQPKMIHCEPIADDRMFVVCLLTEKLQCKTLQETPDATQDMHLLQGISVADWIGEKELYAWEMECIERELDDQSKLYELLFVDENGITCTDRRMRLALLRKHLYIRWIQYGTIYGVTDHSMIAIIPDDNENSAAVDRERNIFLTIRVQMAILVLAQRASIISLCQDAASLSQAFSKHSQVRRRDIRHLMRLQERYVAFQNQLLFFEVTAQEQGVEMYQLLTESLYIHEEIEHLERQLQNLYGITCIASDRKLNRLMTWLTIIGTALALSGIPTLIDWFAPIFGR